MFNNNQGGYHTNPNNNYSSINKENSFQVFPNDQGNINQGMNITQSQFNQNMNNRDPLGQSQVNVDPNWLLNSQNSSNFMNGDEQNFYQNENSYKNNNFSDDRHYSHYEDNSKGLKINYTNYEDLPNYPVGFDVNQVTQEIQSNFQTNEWVKRFSSIDNLRIINKYYRNIICIM